MAEAPQCMRCLFGRIVNGRCSYCGRVPTAPEDRRPDALPLYWNLHGRYTIGDVLGRGGFGITYAAWDTGENRRVAVKELYPCKDVSRLADRCTVQVASGQEGYFSQVYRCFENEARMLMQLQQDGVVRLYHVFDENGTIYYVMEYLDGQDLRTRMEEKGCVSWETLAPIAKTILGALQSLHEKGLIHRDISPDNIFLTRDGNTRLIDFGSVRVYQGNNSFTTFIKQNFAPLEQYKTHGNQGPWTDIYALSVTLYYALSGQLPPIAPERRMNDQTVPLAQLCPRVPAYVVDAIQRGMAVAIEDRCQSAVELAALLFPEPGGATLVPPQPRREVAIPPTGRATHPPQPEPAAPMQRTLYCCAGVKNGQSWSLSPGTILTAGREQCDILYPGDTKGVSRHQCSFYMDERGRVMVRDDGSSWGTCCQGTTITPGTWYLLQPGYRLTFAHELYMIR